MNKNNCGELGKEYVDRDWLKLSYGISEMQ